MRARKTGCGQRKNIRTGVHKMLKKPAPPGRGIVKGENSMNVKIVPCVGCEETCCQIEKLIVTHMQVMSFDMVKYQVRAYWKTLCAFMLRVNDKAVLESLYDGYMRIESRERISKEEFTRFMLQEC